MEEFKLSIDFKHFLRYEIAEEEEKELKHF